MKLKKFFLLLVNLIDLRDILVFGGLFLIAYGAKIIYEPSGFIILGAGFFWIGIRSVKTHGDFSKIREQGG